MVHESAVKLAPALNASRGFKALAISILECQLMLVSKMARSIALLLQSPLLLLSKVHQWKSWQERCCERCYSWSANEMGGVDLLPQPERLKASNHSISFPTSKQHIVTAMRPHIDPGQWTPHLSVVGPDLVVAAMPSRGRYTIPHPRMAQYADCLAAAYSSGLPPSSFPP